MKGKDMILSDFLSQHKNDDSDPSEIIPISFNAYGILVENRNIDLHKRNYENSQFRHILKLKQVVSNSQKSME